jgi:hypothetical protein
VEHIDWRARDQARIEQDSSLREDIFKDITSYADDARRLGVSEVFVAGVELAAEIALLGRREATKEDENTTDK